MTAPTAQHKTNTMLKEMTEEDRLLEKAELVFSKALVEHLKQRGLDILEQDSQGPYFSDADGNRYIDCYTSGGIFNLGRNHPQLSSALEQAAQITDQGNFVAVSEEKATLAARLSQFMPKSLECCLFTVVKGEATDAACKLARGFTKKQKLVTVAGAWHGDTGFALSLSDLPEKSHFGDLIPEITSLPFNEPAALTKVIDTNCAAVIVEPVQAENGCRVADPEWLSLIRLACNQTGTLLIFDESQTGFGRIGSKFAAERYDVLPDILIFGEAITGGMFPMTGISFTAKVKSFFDHHPLIHLCTFGGHDIGCRTALAALDLYDRIKPWENAEAAGNSLVEELKLITANHPEIDAIEGTGLLIAIHFKSEAVAIAMCNKLKQNGIIARQGIIARNSLVLRPPLTLSSKELDELRTKLKKLVSKT